MNTYRLTLRNGHAFTLESPNDIKAITEKLTVTPSTVTTAPFWVFDDATAVYAADIVAFELIAVTNEAPEGVWPPDDRIRTMWFGPLPAPNGELQDITAELAEHSAENDHALTYGWHCQTCAETEPETT